MLHINCALVVSCATMFTVGSQAERTSAIAEHRQELIWKGPTCKVRYLHCEPDGIRQSGTTQKGKVTVPTAKAQLEPDKQLLRKAASAVQKQQQQANRDIFKNLLVRDETLYANTVTAILEYAAHIKDACKTLKPLGGTYWNDFQDQCRGGQPSVSKFIKIADNPAYKDPKLIKCLPNNIAALYELCDLQPKALLAMPSSVATVPKTEFTAKPVINPGLSLNQARALVGKTPPPSHTKTPKPPAPKPLETKPPGATAKHEKAEFLDLTLPATEISAALNAQIKERLTVMLNQLA